MTTAPAVGADAGVGTELAQEAVAAIRRWARELGFQQAAVARIELDQDAQRLQAWLDAGHHGDMSYMARNTELRADPARLVAGTVSVVSLRMNYMSESPDTATARLAQSGQGYIARYALGRDYHKTLRARLRQMAERLAVLIGPFGHRVFTDSAPVLERALARNAGLGWIGKHTNLLNREDGSLFFLGEIFTDLELPVDLAEATDHCGTCVRCIDVCPTGAIVAPYRLDARRCISYLTIEYKGSIPVPLRALLGNRVFGCDDCQLVCPWNRYAKLTSVEDFAPRHGLDGSTLVSLFGWSEREFEDNTRGSAIRRISYEQWLRNIAVALGNAPASDAVRAALVARREHPSALVREHVDWALAQHAG